MKKIIKRILIYFINDTPIIFGFLLIALEYFRITIRLTEDIFERGEKYIMLYLTISYLCYLIISNLKCIKKFLQKNADSDKNFSKTCDFYIAAELLYAFYLGKISSKTKINTLIPLSIYGNKFGNTQMFYTVIFCSLASFIILLWIYFKTKSRNILLFNISLCYGRIFIIFFVIRYTIFK